MEIYTVISKLFPISYSDCCLFDLAMLLLLIPTYFMIQAQIVGDETNRVGLIPSKNLEENRKAFVRSDMDYSKSSLCKQTVLSVRFIVFVCISSIARLIHGDHFFIVSLSSSLHLFVCPSIHLPIYWYIGITSSVCLSVYQSVYLSAHLSFCCHSLMCWSA